MASPGKLQTSSSELDLDRPNIEDYLPSGSSIHEPRGELRLSVHPLPLSRSFGGSETMDCRARARDCVLAGALPVLALRRARSRLVSVAFAAAAAPFDRRFSFCFGRRDLVDVTPALTEAAGAIVDVSVRAPRLAFACAIRRDRKCARAPASRGSASFPRGCLIWGVCAMVDGRIPSRGVSSRIRRSRGTGTYISSRCGASGCWFGT